ncbi:MAG TPA: hypothetical protein VGP96_02600 [Candidatus Dormibacteraeota bacterium]|nr:hypothetical protein [Candidatus Dormibacteraeota bacterium]
MAEMRDETNPRTPRRARARRQQPAAAAVNPSPVTDEAAPAVTAGEAVPAAVERIAAAPRQVVSLYAALESASAEARSMGHPLTLRRSGEGKYVATCSRCGMDLPVLDTARGWTYPSLRACPNPVRTES